MVVKARHKDNIDDNTPEGQAYNRAYFPNLYKQLLRDEVIECMDLYNQHAHLLDKIVTHTEHVNESSQPAVTLARKLGYDQVADNILKNRPLHMRNSVEEPGHGPVGVIFEEEGNYYKDYQIRPLPYVKMKRTVEENNIDDFLETVEALRDYMFPKMQSEDHKPKKGKEGEEKHLVDNPYDFFDDKNWKVPFKRGWDFNSYANGDAYPDAWTGLMQLKEHIFQVNELAVALRQLIDADYYILYSLYGHEHEHLNVRRGYQLLEYGAISELRNSR